MQNVALKHSPTIISNKYKTSVNEPIRVAFYARVSTAHESQVNALENQVEWYNSILRDHPNWQKINVYIDKGVTGTKAVKRSGFMQMINDAYEGKFDLVCRRENSRFARNTVDSLSYTRLLAKYGVEVFFYNDNIWSLEPDGELRLTIMSAMAQEESRHISDRVQSGQAVSREKAILYGNGNILGYNLVRGICSSDNTYEIDPVGAETVRMIYDLYLEGLGVKAIATKMQELGRESALAGCKWDGTKVLRILDNKTYAGYISYKKSFTTNYLEHTRVANRDRSTHEYVKGNFPPIIPEEKWNRVQALKSKKVSPLNKKNGKKISKDRWARILICQCGHTFKKYKWRTTKAGEESYGYQCWHQVNNRSKSFRLKNNLDAEGYCDVPSMCEWKLDFMLTAILERLWKNPKETVNVIIEEVKLNYTQDVSNKDYEIGKNSRELERLKFRMDSLLDMKLDKQIDEETFSIKYNQLQQRINQLEEELKPEPEVSIVEREEDVSTVIKKVREILDEVCDLQGKTLSEQLIKSLVTRITPNEDGTFKWYLKAENDDEVIDFNETDYILYDEFTLEFNDAKTYRKKHGNFIRISQWKDLKVAVYIKNN